MWKRIQEFQPPNVTYQDIFELTLDQNHSNVNSVEKDSRNLAPYQDIFALTLESNHTNVTFVEKSSLDLRV